SCDRRSCSARGWWAGWRRSTHGTCHSMDTSPSCTAEPGPALERPFLDGTDEPARHRRRDVGPRLLVLLGAEPVLDVGVRDVSLGHEDVEEILLLVTHRPDVRSWCRSIG